MTTRALLPCAATVALLALPVAAQDQEDRDRGFLTRLIEDNISAPGLSVRLDGFQGALSSRAELDRLAVSDDEGTWLVMEDVVLDWNRTALLRGRLEVEELSAALIRVERAPLPPEGVEALPDAGASGFSLPNLPVSVDIEQLAADRIELGAPLLGQEVALSLQASAQLADGSGEAQIAAQRLDGPEGQFQIAVAFDGETEALDLNVDLIEDEGGIAATLMQLPGAPAIELTVDGAGPLDDFSADIAILSDGTERLGGRVSLAGTEDGRGFAVDIGGDVTSLFAPRYQPFFGDDVRLVARGATTPQGTELEEFSLDTQALDLQGRLSFGEGGWPTLIDVTGRLAAADGTPVLLPTPTTSTLLSADLSIQHDATVSPRLAVELVLDDYAREDVTLDQASLSVTGQIEREGGTVTSAAADLLALIEGLEFVDPALGDAAGGRLSFSTDITYAEGGPTVFDTIELRGDDMRLSGRVATVPGAEALTLDTDLTLQADELSRFAALSGRDDLSGAAEASIDGTYQPVAGGFDLVVEALTRDLTIGTLQADALLAGQTDLRIDARRTTDGLFVDGLDLSNDRAQVTASAILLDDSALTTDADGNPVQPVDADGNPIASGATLEARLADGTLLAPQLDGEIALAADLDRSLEGIWSGNVDLAAPQGVTVTASGTLTGDAPDIAFSGSLPDVSAFAAGIEGAVTATGRATAEDGVWSVDAEVEGPWDVSARIAGEVTGDRPEIAFSASLPELSGPVPGVAAIEALQGPVTLEGTLAQEGGTWIVDTRVDAPSDVTLTAQGAVTGDMPAIDITARLPRVEAFAPGVPGLEGAATLAGRVAQTDGAWAIDIETDGPSGLTTSVEGPVTGEAPRLVIDALLPEIEAFVANVPGLEGRVALDGTLAQQDGAWLADLAADLPAGATASIAGPVTGPAPLLTLAARIPEVEAFAPGIAGVEGLVTLDGTAAQRDGAWVLDLAASGPSGLDLSVEGPATGPTPRLAVDARVPSVAPFAGDRPGLDAPAALTGTLAQQDGAWGADLALDGPTGLTATLDGVLTGPAPDLTLAARLPDAAPFVPDMPGVTGPVALDATARREGEAWVVDVDLDGPSGVTATLAGAVTGPAPAADLDIRVPDASVFAPATPGLDGPVTVVGTIGDDDGAVAVDLDVSAPTDVSLTLAGTVTGPDAQVDLTARVPEVAAFLPDTPGMQGPLTIDGTARQADGTWEVDLTAEAPQDVTLTAEGTATGPEADLAVSARIPRIEAFVPEVNGVEGPVTLDARLTQVDGAYAIDLGTDGPSGATIALDGTVTGPSPEMALDARIPDVAAFAPGIDGVDGPVTLTGTIARPADAWRVDLASDGPSDATIRVRGPVTGPEAEIDIAATVPRIEAFVPGNEMLQGQVTLDGSVTLAEAGYPVDLRAAGPLGVTATATGPVLGEAARIAFTANLPRIEAVAPAVEGALDLDGVLARQGTDWALTANARGPGGTIADVDTVLTRQPLTLDFGVTVPTLATFAAGVPGGLDASGTATQTPQGWQVDLAGTGPYAATFDAALNLADGVPSVTATGQIPNAGAISPQLRGPIDFDVAARQDADAQWQVEASVDGAQVIDAEVSGIATGPGTDLDFRLAVGNVRAFAPDLPPALAGALNASGRLYMQGGGYAVDMNATGPLGARLTAQGTLTGGSPATTFTLNVPNIGPLVPQIPGPLSVSGRAAQQGDRYALDIDVTGPSGTQAAVDGTVGPGATLNLGVAGTAPLGLANAFLEPNRVAGTARFDLRVSGPPALESVTGTIATSGASLVLPTLGNGLDAIDATIRLTGGQAQLQVTAAPQTGGRIQLSGPVGLAAPFNANLGVQFDITLEDPRLYTADLRGDLRIAGPLTGGATIGGRIAIDGAEISVPNTGITAIGDLPDITHVNIPGPVRTTLDRAGQSVTDTSGDGGAGGGGVAYGLDLTIDAPGRIFVRGRGLDAELGGQLQLQGTTANPVTAGGFELIRGRLDILEQRFTLDEGSITFQGDLTPYVRLVAVTTTETITARIVVEGPADEIDVRFESDPDLPQEEILAQIFFGRDLSQLSAIQALQLANSVATLTGRGSAGLLDNLRGEAGLDDLDLTTDDEGNVAVRAGKYVSDNVYTDVQINQDGEAEISLNLDVTESLTVRGTVGAGGGTSLGVYFERDY